MASRVVSEPELATFRPNLEQLLPLPTGLPPTDHGRAVGTINDRYLVFGVGFLHPQTGEKYTLEFQTYGLLQAISNWEAIRAYMEHEVHTLKEIQDPLELQGPDDPPWEGVHVFRNAKARLHQRRRVGEVGWFHTFGWYLYHLMTFWTLPNRLVEWEVKKIRKMNRRALPEPIQRWSEPLPENERARPSKELKRQSKRVLELQKADPQKPVTEIFAQVGEEFSSEASMIA